MNGTSSVISGTQILNATQLRQHKEEISSVSDIQILWLTIARKLELHEDTIDLYDASIEITEFDYNRKHEATVWLEEKMGEYQPSLAKITCLMIINTSLAIIPNFFFKMLPALTVILLERCDHIKRLPLSFKDLGAVDILIVRDCKVFDDSFRSFGPAVGITDEDISYVRDLTEFPPLPAPMDPREHLVQ
jgi:hypothetical protein